MNKQITSRLFIAIPLVKELKNAIGSMCDEWKSHLHFRKWVHTEDYHITLFFIGETTEDQIPQIHSALDKVVRDTLPFSLKVEGIGFFGRPYTPRILWAGVQGDLDQLRSLQTNISIAMEELGFSQVARPYNPHITLARKYNESATFPKLFIQQQHCEILPLNVEQITLFRTQLGQQPMYEPIHTIRI
jgi:2'-5' RNA ligase